MAIVDKIKNYFKNIFKKQNNNLLESGDHVNNISSQSGDLKLQTSKLEIKEDPNINFVEQSMDENESTVPNYEDPLAEQKAKFNERIMVDLSQMPKTQWKNPEFESTYIYKGKKLPGHMFLENLITEDNAEYLGENKYSIKTDDLNPEQTYELVEKIVSRTADNIGEIMVDSQEECKEYFQMIRSKGQLAEFFMKKEYPEKAIQILDNLLGKSIDYYNEIMTRDEEIIE